MSMSGSSNPHASITLDWFGKETAWEATDPNWQKWKPHQPTSPHWYEQRHLERELPSVGKRLIVFLGACTPEFERTHEPCRFR